MFNQLVRSFLWGYGKRMGSTAARRTSFLAVPMLLGVGYLMLVQLGVIEPLPVIEHVMRYLP